METENSNPTQRKINRHIRALRITGYETFATVMEELLEVVEAARPLLILPRIKTKADRKKHEQLKRAIIKLDKG